MFCKLFIDILFACRLGNNCSTFITNRKKNFVGKSLKLYLFLCFFRRAVEYGFLFQKVPVQFNNF